MTLANAIETAKAKAAGNAKWIRAIDRAALALTNNEIRVHLFGDFALVASKNGCYKITDHCECKAAQAGHRECYHRAAVRIVEMMEAPALVEISSTTVDKFSTAPTITRSTERNYRGPAIEVVRIEGWAV
jgi:hypothetical protein